MFSYLENQNKYHNLYNMKINLSAILLIYESGCYKNTILHLIEWFFGENKNLYEVQI